MENPPSRFYLVLFSLFAIGLLGDVITRTVEAAFPKPFPQLFLIPASFVAGYFISVLPQEPYKLVERLLGVIPAVTALIALLVSVFLPDDNPASLFLYMFAASYLAGWVFAQASSRFRAIVKP